jgi:hypothetical protein
MNCLQNQFYEVSIFMGMIGNYSIKRENPMKPQIKRWSFFFFLKNRGAPKK